MTIITFDVECIGCDDPAVVADIAASIKPPGTLKKAETIAKWEAEEKPGAIEEAVLKTCFDGALGKIVCIGWAVNDDSPQSACSGPESAIIASFFASVQVSTVRQKHSDHIPRSPTFVGHNISGFDLRFLWQRAVVLGIKPPSCIPFKAKPWDSTIADTMVMWDQERSRKITLDALCKTLGVPTPKVDMDGSKVWDAFKAGRIDEIAAYCRGDVEATRECYYRMMFREAA